MNNNVFDNFVINADQLKYYTIPAEYPLFKASKADRAGMSLKPDRFYFFGVKNMDPGYIDEYEDIYGIIYEFKTTQPLKLLALDDRDTVNKLYEDDDINYKIQDILDDNYGHMNGIRDSQSDKDRELSQYLCNKGYDGYAIEFMLTDTGVFHSEFMICNASSKVEYVGRITSDEHVEHILEDARLKRLDQEREDARKAARKAARKDREIKTESSNPIRLFDSPITERTLFDSPVKKRKGLFNDDDDDDVRGGRRKQRKTRAKKQTRNRNRKTRKGTKRNSKN